MKKESVTQENIQEDLLKMIAVRNDRVSWRLAFILPLSTMVFLFTVLAALIDLLFLWGTLAVFLVDVYHIVRYFMAVKSNQAIKKEMLDGVDRADFAISVETLSHIMEEDVYEPSAGVLEHGRITHGAKFFCFESGLRWRLPEGNFTHYEWSEVYDLSSAGLDNTSVIGDTFYFVTLQLNHDVGYIYNTKLFDFSSIDKNTD